MSGSRNPERLLFDAERDVQLEQWRGVTGGCLRTHHRDERGWIFFGPRDIRDNHHEYLWCLQKRPGQKLPRVRVGCRYYTLPQAWKHWGVGIRKAQLTTRKNQCRQAVAIIRLMLVQAQALGLLSRYRPVPVFDNTIIKPKRK